MTRGLGSGGRPLGNSQPEPEQPAPQRRFTPDEVRRHNAAVDRINYYRSHAYPAYGTADADTMVREASQQLVTGAVEYIS